MEKVILSLGSNVGNRKRYIENAIKELSLLHNFLYISSGKIYESEPWGFKDQKNFLNCIVAGLYRSNPEDLLNEIKKLENKLGRKIRGKWNPREIDIDILFFGNKILIKKNLIIPHPLILSRNFVLKPLMELIPEYVHPVFKKRIITLAKKTKDKGKVVLC